MMRITTRNSLELLPAAHGVPASAH
ncbi:hypothetical protein A2U01_0059441, partial [Trifolium medium]|nr:hypothetical protein [Trifolium medium]